MKGAFIIREVKGGYSLNYRMPDGELIFKPSVFPDYHSVTEMAKHMATDDNSEKWAVGCFRDTNDYHILFINDESGKMLFGKDKSSSRKAKARLKALRATFADAETIVLKKGERLKPSKVKTDKK
jgi:hypothetical protein